MSARGNSGRRRLAGAAIRCQPDSRLVGLVRDGHDLAFEEIVRRYRSQLVSYAGAIVPEHRAEDVVQEALTRAHAALAKNRAEMNLRPWLYTIVRNGALNSLRNEPVYVHLDENYDGVPQPPEVAARREELAALTASVKDLPEPQREALVKRELEGRSHDEIAASLGVSAGAVRGLIYRARATLRDAAGMLIPLPVLRALLSSGPVTSDATGAAGAAAVAAGGGGVALKAGATLGVAVIAVGSGIAIQQRNSGASDRGTAQGPSHSAHALEPNGPNALRLADSAAPTRSGNEGPGSAGSGNGGGDGSSGSSSGPGSGSGERSGGGSSGPGPGGSGGDDGGLGGSGESGGDGGSSGPGGGGDDGISGHDDGGGGTSGTGGDDGTSGSGGGDDGSGGSGGSGSSGSGSGDGGGATSGGGDDGGSGGSGSGDDGGTTTTTTTTTTPTDGGGDGSSGGSD